MNASGTEIKQFVLIKLPDSGAVRTLYVVGKDLELGFRVDVSLV